MHYDEFLHDEPHTSRAQIAELLNERRNLVAGEIVTRLQAVGGPAISMMIARTLVHALAQSLAEGEPDVVIHWSRMVHHAHAVPLVVAMVETGCQVVEELAHREHGDLASIVVFLEIVKSRAAAQYSDEAFTGREPASSDAAIESLLAMLRARDDATCNHSRATGEWCRRIATRIGLGTDVAERIVRAGILHDIGKIRVPDAILLKPAALDRDEWEVMKGHAEAGAEILSHIPSLAQYAPIVAMHHEWFDGRGYPYGLRGDEITLEARIVSVADSFHAMVTDRPYRRALSYGEAMSVFADGRWRQWDGDVADAMIALAAEARNTSADADLSAFSSPLSGSGTILRPGDAQAI